MRISLNIFTVMLAIIASSCKPKITWQEYDKSREKVFLAYCANDVNAAERALLDDLQTISTWESNHVADFADYDACKLRDHERLFLIYRATHATNKMEYEFQQSLKCLNDSRTRWKSPPANLTPADIVSGLEKIESNVNVQWKTNFNF